MQAVCMFHLPQHLRIMHSFTAARDVPSPDQLGTCCMATIRHRPAPSRLAADLETLKQSPSASPSTSCSSFTAQRSALVDGPHLSAASFASLLITFTFTFAFARAPSLFLLTTPRHGQPNPLRCALVFGLMSFA
jgi:hypothetical protein